MLQEVICEDIEIGAALFRDRLEAQRTGIGGGRQEGAAAEHDVSLLSGSKLGEE